MAKKADTMKLLELAREIESRLTPLFAGLEHPDNRAQAVFNELSRAGVRLPKTTKRKAKSK